MKKTLIAIAATTVAMATFASSSAEAGFHFGGHRFCGHHHGLIGAILRGALHHHRHRWHPEYVVRTPVEPVYAARRPETVNVPKEEEPEPAVSAVENENSSIAVAAPIEVSSTAEPEPDETIIQTKNKPAERITRAAKIVDASAAPVSTTAKRLDCKQFFPSVGMTLSVPCE